MVITRPRVQTSSKHNKRNLPGNPAFCQVSWKGEAAGTVSLKGILRRPAGGTRLSNCAEVKHSQTLHCNAYRTQKQIRIRSYANADSQTQLRKRRYANARRRYANAGGPRAKRKTRIRKRRYARNRAAKRMSDTSA